MRLDVADSAVLAHGVIADDKSHAIIAHVQMGESQSNRGMWLRIPGLDPLARYKLSWTGPEPVSAALESLNEVGPIGNATMTGAALATVGVRIPRCKPETIRLIEITQC